ncbi:MAG: magnesium transporter, partial [Gammaproteobacteria bacterium]|nr:magnesium transporter [Gammaproteobacteria bacterium]
MADNDPVEKTESQLKALSAALETGTMQHARRMLNELNSAEIADLLESLPYTERNLLWDLVNPEKEGD